MNIKKANIIIEQISATVVIGINMPKSQGRRKFKQKNRLVSSTYVVLNIILLFFTLVIHSAHH
jgi:uncharacterized protein Veg